MASKPRHKREKKPPRVARIVDIPANRIALIAAVAPVVAALIAVAPVVAALIASPASSVPGPVASSSQPSASASASVSSSTSNTDVSPVPTGSSSLPSASSPTVAPPASPSPTSDPGPAPTSRPGRNCPRPGPVTGRTSSSPAPAGMPMTWAWPSPARWWRCWCRPRSWWSSRSMTPCSGGRARRCWPPPGSTTDSPPTTTPPTTTPPTTTPPTTTPPEHAHERLGVNLDATDRRYRFHQCLDQGICPIGIMVISSLSAKTMTTWATSISAADGPNASD